MPIMEKYGWDIAAKVKAQTAGSSPVKIIPENIEKIEKTLRDTAMVLREKYSGMNNRKDFWREASSEFTRIVSEEAGIAWRGKNQKELYDRFYEVFANALMLESRQRGILREEGIRYLTKDVLPRNSKVLFGVIDLDKIGVHNTLAGGITGGGKEKVNEEKLKPLFKAILDVTNEYGGYMFKLYTGDEVAFVLPSYYSTAEAEQFFAEIQTRAESLDMYLSAGIVRADEAAPQEDNVHSWLGNMLLQVNKNLDKAKAYGGSKVIIGKSPYKISDHERGSTTFIDESSRATVKSAIQSNYQRLSESGAFYGNQIEQEYGLVKEKAFNQKIKEGISQGKSYVVLMLSPRFKIEGKIAQYMAKKSLAERKDLTTLRDDQYARFKAVNGAFGLLGGDDMIATIVHATFASLPDEWLRGSIMARAPPEEIAIALPAELFESHKEDFLSTVARVTDAIQNKIHELSVVQTRLDVNIVSTQDFQQNAQEKVFPTLELMKLSDMSAEHLETQQGNKVKLYTQEQGQAISEEARQFEQEIKKPVAQAIYDDFKANLQVRRDLEERGAITETPTRLLAIRDVRQKQAKDLAEVSAFTVRDYQDSLRRNLYKLGDISERKALSDLNDLVAQGIFEKRIQNGENIYYKSASQEIASSPVVSGKAAETAQHMKELYAVPAWLSRIGQFFEGLQQFFSGKNKESTAVESSATTADDGQPAPKSTPPSIQNIPPLESERAVLPLVPPTSVMPPDLGPGAPAIVPQAPIGMPMQLGLNQKVPFEVDSKGNIKGTYELDRGSMTAKADTGTRADALPFGRGNQPATAIPATAPRGIAPSVPVGDAPTPGGTGSTGGQPAPIVHVVKKAPSQNAWFAQLSKASIGEAPYIEKTAAESHNPLRTISVASRTNFGRSGTSPTIILAAAYSTIGQAVQKLVAWTNKAVEMLFAVEKSEVYVSNSSDHNGLSHNGQNEGVADSRSVSQAVRVANGVNGSRSTQSTLIYTYVRGRLAEVAKLVAEVLKYYGHEFVLVNRKGSREYRTAGVVEAASESADNDSESGPATVGLGLALRSIIESVRVIAVRVYNRNVADMGSRVFGVWSAKAAEAKNKVVGAWVWIVAQARIARINDRSVGSTYRVGSHQGEALGLRAMRIAGSSRAWFLEYVGEPSLDLMSRIVEGLSSVRSVGVESAYDRVGSIKRTVISLVEYIRLWLKAGDEILGVCQGEVNSRGGNSKNVPFGGLVPETTASPVRSEKDRTGSSTSASSYGPIMFALTGSKSFTLSTSERAIRASIYLVRLAQLLAPYFARGIPGSIKNKSNINLRSLFKGVGAFVQASSVSGHWPLATGYSTKGGLSWSDLTQVVQILKSSILSTFPRLIASLLQQKTKIVTALRSILFSLVRTVRTNAMVSTKPGKNSIASAEAKFRSWFATLSATPVSRATAPQPARSINEGRGTKDEGRGMAVSFIPHPLSIVENASSPVDSKDASRRGIGRVAGVWKSLIANRLQAAAAVLDYPRTFVFACDFSSCGPEDPIARLWRGFQPDQPFGRGLFLYRRDVWGGVSVIVAGAAFRALRSLYPRAYYGFVFVVFTVVSKAVLFVLERRGSKETQEGALFKMQDTAEKKDHQEDKASSPVKSSSPVRKRTSAEKARITEEMIQKYFEGARFTAKDGREYNVIVSIRLWGNEKVIYLEAVSVEEELYTRLPEESTLPEHPYILLA